MSTVVKTDQKTIVRTNEEVNNGHPPFTFSKSDMIGLVLKERLGHKIGKILMETKPTDPEILKIAQILQDHKLDEGVFWIDDENFIDFNRVIVAIDPKLTSWIGKFLTDHHLPGQIMTAFAYQAKGKFKEWNPAE